MIESSCWLSRCAFPKAPSRVDCAFSGGPDSTALIILARAAGLDVTAHHVDHGHRPGTAAEAKRAAEIAACVGVDFHLHRARIDNGPNFEATARAARRRLIGVAAMTGHTLDDLAETVLYRLLRGSGPEGLIAMQLGLTHPILGLRRHETELICAEHQIEPLSDPTNSDSTVIRNRIRNELIPLANEIVRRDSAVLIARTSELAASQRDLIESLIPDIDPTDAHAVASLDDAAAIWVLRRWVQSHHHDQYPPPRAAMLRVLAVARGDATACELPGGIRVERSRQRLRITSR